MEYQDIKFCSTFHVPRSAFSSRFELSMGTERQGVKQRNYLMVKPSGKRQRPKNEKSCTLTI